MNNTESKIKTFAKKNWEGIAAVGFGVAIAVTFSVIIDRRDAKATVFRNMLFAETLDKTIDEISKALGNK